MEIPKALSAAKTGPFERVALRLSNDTGDVQEALALLNHALAELRQLPNQPGGKGPN